MKKILTGLSLGAMIFPFFLAGENLKEKGTPLQNVSAPEAPLNLEIIRLRGRILARINQISPAAPRRFVEPVVRQHFPSVKKNLSQMHNSIFYSLSSLSSGDRTKLKLSVENLLSYVSTRNIEKEQAVEAEKEKEMERDWYRNEVFGWALCQNSSKIDSVLKNLPFYNDEVREDKEFALCVQEALGLVLSRRPSFVFLTYNLEDLKKTLKIEGTVTQKALSKRGLEMLKEGRSRFENEGYKYSTWAHIESIIHSNFNLASLRAAE